MGDVFRCLFPAGLPTSQGSGPNQCLLRLLQSKVAQQFRDVDSWIRTSSGKDFGSKEFPRFRNAIRLQLQGLGLITIFRFSTDNVDEEEWALTD